MTKDNFPIFKGRAEVVIRDVPFWAIPFQRFGLFKKAGKIVSRKIYKNVFVNAGKASLLNGLGGANSGYITWLSVGNGNTVGTPPAATDTQLLAEIYRNEIGVANVVGLTLTISTFFPTAAGGGPPAGAYTELGFFGDATASVTPNSGTMFTHLAITETIASGQSVTINYDIIAL